ncbi:transposase [Rickettsiella massiliensis]|uniref:transposase n=1 Tax=Rickettsiella massiliensis TaxID=676517 RepID=UPI00029B120D|nr:transposase [Rickettsiella massiliensis]
MGYCKTDEEYVQNILKRTIEISIRITPGWKILAKKWFIERTVSWLNHFRRLAKDFQLAVFLLKIT